MFAAIEEFGFALLPVEQEILLKSPVQKSTVTDQGVCEIGLGGCGFAKYLVRVRLVFEYGENASLGVANVTAKVGRKEALHVCSYGCFNQDALPRQAFCSNGRDDGVLVFEGSSDRVYR